MQKYDVLIDRISRASGISAEEVEQKVEAKKEKLSGLISKEGAAQIIAAELGINFDDQDVKINELLPGMKKVNVIGKILNIFPVREYEKNDRKGKVANFILADETGSTRAVLWDTNHIELIENETIKVGDVVEIKNGSTRDTEIHLSGFSEIKKSNTKLEEVKTQAPVSKAPLSDARQGQSIEVRGVVAQVFQPRFYQVCPECNKKVNSQEDKHTCAEHGNVIPKKRSILNFVVDDGTESMRVVMFSEQINKVIKEEELQDTEKAIAFRDDFLGTEITIAGPVKRNQLFNNLEIIANDVVKINVEELIKELEA